MIGYLGQVHPSTAKAYDLTETYVAELDLDRLLATENAALIYQAVSKFPSVNRDIALLVDEKTSNQTILQTIEQAAGRFLTDIHLFDVYQGKNIDSNKKSMAYRLTFANPEATLTDEEINQAMSKITRVLEESLQVEIR